jgi:hypothetical protein
VAEAGEKATVSVCVYPSCEAAKNPEKLPPSPRRQVSQGASLTKNDVSRMSQMQGNPRAVLVLLPSLLSCRQSCNSNVRHTKQPHLKHV